MVLGLFCLFVGKLNAQVFTNGNLSTGATASTGAPAPAGYTWSEVQTGNNNAGYSANITNGFSVADDFTVNCGTWDLTKFTCYSYSTGYAGATSPIVDLRMQIFDVDPSVGTPTPIFGDLTTNRLTTSTNANLYRIFNGTPGTTRNVWKNEANITLSLTPGTYWVEWQIGVQAGLTSNFSPASTVVGTVTQAGNNAQQHDNVGGIWTPILDGPGGADPQDMPFRLDYLTTVCTGTPAPGNTISSDATVCPGNLFTLSPQNPTCGSGVTYQWQSSTTGTAGSFTDIAGATNATYSTTQTAATYYQVVVSCSGTAGPVSAVLVDLSPANQCYCIPASSVCTDGDIITNVTLNSLNNTSDCEPDGFINYGADPTVPIPDVVQGIPNPISVTAGGGTFDEFVGVWIDYDHSGTFDASEFTSVGTTTGGTLVANINVPASAPLGQARMRVRVQYFNPFAAGDACTPAFLAFGETEDYLVNIITCVQGSFDAQPVNTSVVCGNNVSFSTSVSGTLITYQWQEKIGSGPWTNVINGGQYGGATTNTLTLSSVTTGSDGNLYRVLISGGCTAIDFSDIVTLTVSPLVINVDPASYSTCAPIPAGSPVPLTITTVAGGSVSTTTSYASGVINLLVPDIGPDMTGVTTALTVPPLPAGAVVTGASVTLNTNHSYVGDLIIALKAPNNNTLSLDYALGATGGPGATTVGFVNTEISSDGVTALVDGTEPWTGLFAADAFPDPGAGFFPVAPTSLTTGPIVTTWGELFSVPDGTWTLGLYDYSPPDEGTLVDWTLKLTYVVTSSAPFAGVWTPSAGLFLDAAGVTPYDGTAQTVVYAAPSSTTVYTVTVTNSICPPDPVEVAVTILSADPTVTVTASPFTKIFPGLRTMLTATVAPTAGTNTFQWFHDGDIIPGAITNMLEVGFGNYGLGTYTVKLTDPTICSGNVSASIDITDSTSNTLFIWPNPNNGIFQVRYDDGLSDIYTKPPYLGVFDSKGARLSNKSYKIVTAYQRMDVDMSSMPNGIYIVVLYDNSGTLLKSGRVVIRK